MEAKRKTKKQLIKEHLQAGRSITPMEALKLYDSFRLAAVIHVLREKEGLNIITNICQSTTGAEYAQYYIPKQ